MPPNQMMVHLFPGSHQTGTGILFISASVANTAGYEVMNMIRKGQMQGVNKGDIFRQVTLITSLFWSGGLSATRRASSYLLRSVTSICNISEISIYHSLSFACPVKHSAISSNIAALLPRGFTVLVCSCASTSAVRRSSSSGSITLLTSPPHPYSTSTRKHCFPALT